MTTREILEQAVTAKIAINSADTETKNKALANMADELLAHTDAILEANKQDVEAAKGKISDVMIDRLMLDAGRIEGMAKGIRELICLEDPAGKVIRTVERPNGIIIEKTAVPMGVIAIIYESRPNVTSDAAALCIKSGNVCVLRSGKEAWKSADAVVKALKEGMRKSGLPAEGIQLIEDTKQRKFRRINEGSRICRSLNSKRRSWFNPLLCGECKSSMYPDRNRNLSCLCRCQSRL